MKKSKLGLSLLALVTLMTSCNKNPSAVASPSNNSRPSAADSTAGSNNSGSSNTNTGSNTGSNTNTPSTPKEPTPTEALTEDMFASFKEGYVVSYGATKQYLDGSEPSTQYYKAESTADKYRYETYTKKDGVNLKKYGKTNYYHAVEENGILYTYQVSLGLDNTVHSQVVTEEDDFTHQDFNLEWEYSYFGNVLANFSVADFSKKDSNTFVLSADKTAENSYALKTQFFAPNSLYLPGSDCNYFALKTDGDSIVGFELTCKTYTAIDVAASFSSSGTFEASGADSFEDLKTLTGATNPEFDAIMAKLKTYNWNLTQTQSQYDYSSESMNALGTMYITSADNGSKEYWEYYNTDNKRTSAYGYMDYTDHNDPENTGKLGVVKIGDYYYQDTYLYSGSMREKMPSFNLDSRFFKKDTAASVNGKKVYKIDPTIEISDENYATEYITPENMRAYKDRLINITVTEDGDTITLRNTTSSGEEDSSGLIMNCEYKNIGKVTGFMDETSLKDSVAGLKWSDLISVNEASCDSILAVFGQDNIDSLPIIDDRYANIYVDVSNSTSKPIFYIYVYDEDELNGLMTSYGEKLIASGLEVDTSETASDTTTYYVKHNVSIKGNRGQTYVGDLSVSLSKYYNSIQDWGQFQIQLSTKNLKTQK